jgi:hypothetical protein
MEPVTALGWCEENGGHKYRFGNATVTADGIALEDDISKDNSLPYQFAYDESMTESESVGYMLCLMKLLPHITIPLVGNFIVGLLYPLFKKAGARPKHVMCIIGKSGILKTSLSILANSIYDKYNDNDSCKICLTSSLSAVEEKICQMRNCTVVLDDFFVAVEGKQEQVLRGIIRSLSEGSRETNAHGKYVLETTAVITGEKMLSDTSTLNRMVVMLMKNAPNMRLLNKLQDTPLALPTFTRHFLQWVCKNYENIVSHISREFRNHRKAQELHPNLQYERARENCFVN